jgi:hypothetical protein
VHYSSGDSEAVTISSSPDTVQPEALSLGNTETDVTDETKQSQQNTPIANTEATELETSSSTTSAQDSHVINADQFDPEVIQASCDKVVSSSSRNDATTVCSHTQMSPSIEHRYPANLGDPKVTDPFFLD